MATTVNILLIIANNFGPDHSLLYGRGPNLYSLSSLAYPTEVINESLVDVAKGYLTIIVEEDVNNTLGVCNNTMCVYIPWQQHTHAHLHIF